MCHSRFANLQKGSALVMAIFVIVIMTILGSALMRMMSATSESVAYEVLGTRAFQAAQVGLQWELQQLFPLGTGASACQNQATINAGIPDLSAIDGLINCRIAALTCEDFLDGSIRYYQVTSTGQCDINGEVTSRTIEVQARSLP